MRISTISAVLLALILSGVAAAGAADVGPWRHVEVRLVDGTILRDVTVSRVAGGADLQITRSDGAERRVRWASVVSVVDGAGVELREEIASGGDPVPPPSPGDPEIGSAAPLVRAASVLERPNPWYFNWMIGGGVAAVRTIGGSFPERDTSTPLTTALYRRVSRTWFLGLASATAVDLGRQDLYSWDGAHDRVQEWSDEMLALSVGRYAESSLFVWEVGPAALKRLDYLKLGFRVQAGWWVTLGGHWTLSPALYIMLKPGFEDADGGTATELGLKIELLVR